MELQKAEALATVDRDRAQHHITFVAEEIAECAKKIEELEAEIARMA